MKQPITLIAPDRLDDWLQTARARGVKPSLLAEIVGQLNRTQPVRCRAVATWRWHRHFGAMAQASNKN